MTSSGSASWRSSALLALQALVCIALAADQSVFSKASNDSLLWGAYRPNLYFGVRPRLPKSLTTGLMWARVTEYNDVQNNFRHTCEQHAGMHGYGWDSYDPRYGGSQVIRDADNGIDISTDFVKFPDRGSNGGSWGARIKGSVPEGGNVNVITTVVFYLGLEGLGAIEPDDVTGDTEELGYTGDIKFTGQTSELGDFTVAITTGKGHEAEARHPAAEQSPMGRTKVHSVQVPEAAIWQAKSVLFTGLKQTVDSYIQAYGEDKMPEPWLTYRLPNKPGHGNLHFVQKTFQGPFEFDIIYSQGGAKPTIKSSDLTTQIEKVNTDIEIRYKEIHSTDAPFKTSEKQSFSKSLFSNLIGGIGYFYGDQMIDRSNAPEYEEENEGFWEETAAARERKAEQLEGPYELFTSIPSRPFFPRGFLWDEGFHLLPIVDWDIELTLQIVKSWFTTMDEDGWIPREQILGPEARSKVPPEFQVQYPHYANPPTLFFIVDALVQKAKEKEIKNGHPFISTGTQIHSYLAELYPLLKRQYSWFRKTQRGEIKQYDRKAFSTKEGYRWRGSTKAHLLTSGLDDYPRAVTPHPGELHVDLISWVGRMTKSLRDVAHVLGEADDEAEFASIANAIERNIVDLHWSKEHKAFCDSTVDEFEESVHVCHKGYISIFPFMLGLIGPKDDEKLGAVLDLIGDEEELWSNRGIRSLSKKDDLYKSGENYWRSPVWINMNYLILQELYNTATSKSTHAAKAKDLYTRLRLNLVATVYDSWKETGFAWEQYDPETGRGQRTQHFTGWTSLVVKIMAMPDLSGGTAREAAPRAKEAQAPVVDAGAPAQHIVDEL